MLGVYVCVEVCVGVGVGVWGGGGGELLSWERGQKGALQ